MVGGEKMKNILKTFIGFVLINLILFIALRQQAFKASWIIFGILAFLFALSLIIVVGLGIVNLSTLIFRQQLLTGAFLKKSALWSLALLMMLVGQVLMSEGYAYIPETSELAYSEQVNINDTQQHIIVRGEDESNPVILFLAGGPGGSQVQATRQHLKYLEDEFTIVNWEQPGSGMSYKSRDISTLTPQTYVLDAHALTQYLKDRFEKDKIYLMGESWGSYLAIELATQYPDDYHAIVTTGQMVDFAETEEYCYDKALEIARETNDDQQVKALENLGRPPLTEGNISLDSATYLTYLHQYMAQSDDVNHVSWSTFDTLFSPEYSITDSLNFMRALYFTFSHVYKQLYTTDLRQTHTDIDVPIYILHGRHDVNAPVYLVEEYYNLINAPEKELIFFERSGHNPWITEAELFSTTVKNLLTE